MLHITNGDSVLHTLAQAGLPGDVTATRDILHEGPCPTGADPTEWRETRARYLADAGYTTYEDALERYVDEDAALHAARSHDEVVLWFEHDLHDQLLLIRLLAWFAGRGAGSATLSLICIGSFPGISRFVGLGQLTGDQLASLFPARTQVRPEQLALGAEAWQRFGAPDPSGFAALLVHDTTALPYLANAVRRQLEQFPWTRNGLSRSEHQALAAVAAGATDAGTAFRSAQEMETRIFMGDDSFYYVLRTLAEAPLPLVHLDPAGLQALPAQQHVALTALGREVLAGRADHARLNGIDRWIGGVHLRGRTPQWRWDGEAGLKRT